MAYGTEQASTVQPEILALAAWAGWWIDVSEPVPAAPVQGSPLGLTVAAASRP